MPVSTFRTPFYGWKVVWGLLFILTFATGLSFYNHAVILNALAADPAFTVQSASLAVSLFFLASGFTGIWVARWVQRYDLRYCMTFGAVLCAASLAALGGVRSVWQLCLVYVLFGAGFCASNLIPATTLVTRWFQRRRALALSVASTGLSLGGVVVTPVCALLVESLGMTVAGPIMGALYLIGVIPATWLILRPDPGAMGLMPDGDPPKVTSTHPADPVVPAVDQAHPLEVSQGRRFFWGMNASFIFLMLGQVGGIAHQYGLAREQLSESETALAVAIVPIASIIGRLVGGWLVTGVSMYRFAVAMMLLQVVALSFLAVGANTLTLYMGLAFFGITVGNLLMLQPLLIAEAFGVQDYPRIFSLNSLISSWGTASGPLLLGAVYAANGNAYSMAYGAAAVSGVLGLMCFLAGGRPGRLQ